MDDDAVAVMRDDDHLTHRGNEPVEAELRALVVGLRRGAGDLDQDQGVRCRQRIVHRAENLAADHSAVRLGGHFAGSDTNA
jgi:hypothetical protein